MLIDFKQQKMQISVASMQTSVWAAVRMLALHMGTVPIWRLRQYQHETKGAPGGVQGRAALRAGAKAALRAAGCVKSISANIFNDFHFWWRCTQHGDFIKKSI